MNNIPFWQDDDDVYKTIFNNEYEISKINLNEFTGKEEILNYSNLDSENLYIPYIIDTYNYYGILPLDDLF